MRAAKRWAAGPRPSTRAQSRTARAASSSLPACQKARVIRRSPATLRGEHEPLDALLRGVGLGEVHEAHASRGHRAYPVAEAHAGPLLNLLAVRVGVGAEVDPFHRADAPLGVGQAAGVAVDHRVVGHAAAEGVVLRAVLRVFARALLGLVGAPPRLFALPARSCRADADGVARDLPPARSLRETLEP